jgi:hypothetical protein
MTKVCPVCLQTFGPAVKGARRENPATFQKRITCSRKCAGIKSRKSYRT